jgi:hypothetical protein
MSEVDEIVTPEGQAGSRPREEIDERIRKNEAAAQRAQGGAT